MTIMEKQRQGCVEGVSCSRVVYNFQQGGLGRPHWGSDIHSSRDLKEVGDFLNLSTVGILTWGILRCGGLSCAL